MSKGDGAGVSSQMCGPRPTGTEAVGSMTAIRGAGVAEWGLGPDWRWQWWLGYK